MVGDGGAQFDMTREFDGHFRLAALDHRPNGASSPTMRWEYGWADSGMMDSKKFVHDKNDGSDGDLFDYDGLHRLVGSKLGVPDTTTSYAAAAYALEIAYSLDDAQNRNSVTETLSGQAGVTTTYGESDNRYTSVSKFGVDGVTSIRW